MVWDGDGMLHHTHDDDLRCCNVDVVMVVMMTTMLDFDGDGDGNRNDDASLLHQTS